MMRCEGDLVDSCDSRNGVGDDVVVLKLMNEVGETCRRHANIVSNDQPTLIIERRK